MSKTLKEISAEAHEIWKIEFAAKKAREAAEARTEKEAEEAAEKAWKALSEAEKMEAKRKEKEAQIAKHQSDFVDFMRKMTGMHEVKIINKGEEFEAEIDTLRFVPDDEFLEEWNDLGLAAACLVLTCYECNNEYLSDTIFDLPDIHEVLEKAKTAECDDCLHKKYNAEREAKRAARKQQKAAKEAQLNA